MGHFHLSPNPVSLDGMFAAILWTSPILLIIKLLSKVRRRCRRRKTAMCFDAFRICCWACCTFYKPSFCQVLWGELNQFYSHIMLTFYVIQSGYSMASIRPIKDLPKMLTPFSEESEIFVDPEAILKPLNDRPRLSSSVDSSSYR